MCFVSTPRNFTVPSTCLQPDRFEPRFASTRLTTMLSVFCPTPTGRRFPYLPTSLRDKPDKRWAKAVMDYTFAILPFGISPNPLQSLALLLFRDLFCFLSSCYHSPDCKFEPCFASIISELTLRHTA